MLQVRKGASVAIDRASDALVVDGSVEGLIQAALCSLMCGCCFVGGLRGLSSVTARRPLAVGVDDGYGGRCLLRVLCLAD